MRVVIGTVVHYRSGGVCRPALVVGVTDQSTVDLIGFGVSGGQPAETAVASVPRANTPTNGTWHWAEHHGGGA